MWSDAARAASAEVRRQRAKGKKKRSIRTQMNLARDRTLSENSKAAYARAGDQTPLAVRQAVKIHSRRADRYQKLFQRLQDKQRYARQLKREAAEWGTLPGGQKVFGAGIYRRGR